MRYSLAHFSLLFAQSLPNRRVYRFQATSDDYLVYNYNRFQACRFGLDGFLIHPHSNESLSLREDILATLRRLTPHAVALGSEAALDELQFAASYGGNHSRLLRQTYAREGSPQSMVEIAMSQFRSPGAA